MSKKNKINQIVIDTLGISLFTTICKPNQIKPDHYLITDLLMDSGDFVLLTMELEDAFNIKIPDKVPCTWSTVQDIYNSLGAK